MKDSNDSADIKKASTVNYVLLTVHIGETQTRTQATASSARISPCWKARGIRRSWSNILQRAVKGSGHVNAGMSAVITVTQLLLEEIQKAGNSSCQSTQKQRENEKHRKSDLRVSPITSELTKKKIVTQGPLTSFHPSVQLHFS